MTPSRNSDGTDRVRYEGQMYTDIVIVTTVHPLQRFPTGFRRALRTRNAPLRRDFILFSISCLWGWKSNTPSILSPTFFLLTLLCLCVEQTEDWISAHCWPKLDLDTIVALACCSRPAYCLLGITTHRNRRSSY